MLILVYARQGMLRLWESADFDIDGWLASRAQAFQTLHVERVEVLRLPAGISGKPLTCRL